MQGVLPIVSTMLANSFPRPSVVRIGGFGLSMADPPHNALKLSRPGKSRPGGLERRRVRRLSVWQSIGTASTCGYPQIFPLLAPNLDAVRACGASHKLPLEHRTERRSHDAPSLSAGQRSGT